MNILIPITVTPAMLSAGTTIAEPAASETAWVSAGAYVIGDLRIRTTTHHVYRCAQVHTGRTALPEDDDAYWQDIGPTLRYAPFDSFISTTATATTSLTYVLQPGFFNGLALYGLVGSTIAITVKDAPGGSIIYSYTGDLYEQAVGFYELLFTPPLPLEKVLLFDILINPTAELTITVSGGTGDSVGIGMINIGDWRPVVAESLWGGVQYGARGDLKDFSYVKFEDDGKWKIKRRGGATDVTGTVKMSADSANYAHSTVKQVLGIPVSCLATKTPKYEYLSVFGLISGSVVSDDYGSTSFNFAIRSSI